MHSRSANFVQQVGQGTIRKAIYVCTERLLELSLTAFDKNV